MIIPTLPVGDLESEGEVPQVVIMNNDDDNERWWITHDVPGPVLS